jgi:hypothetical protein
MITNESEIRVAVQAMLVCALALWGFWSCAAVLLILLVPWRPFFAVSVYLAKPIVDWRQRKARAHREKGVAQIEKQLDTFLSTSRDGGQIPPRATVPKTKVVRKSPKPEPPRPLQASQSDIPGTPAFQDLTLSAQNLLATLAIPSEIADHVRNLPQGAFSNMGMEVEQVKFREDTAEADVKFQSPDVKESSIRQRYILRKSGGQWKVETRRPANGGSNLSPQSLPAAKDTKKARVA